MGYCMGLVKLRYEIKAQMWYRKSFLYRRRLLSNEGHLGAGVEVDYGGYSISKMIDKDLLFIHIPKCAGTTINTSLFSCLGGGHLRAIEYRAMLGRTQFNNLHKFTVIRDPWERLYSAYRHLRGGADRSRQIRNSKLRSLVELDFSGFVMGLNYHLIYLTELVIKPQFLFLSERFCPKKILLDKIYIQSQVDPVIMKYGGVALQKNNSSGPPMDRNEIYTPALVQRVASLYPEDVELYAKVSNYTSDVQNESISRVE